MDLKLLDSRKDFVKFSRMFLSKNQTSFQRSKSLFMDFKISGKREIVNLRVFYSKKDKIFMTTVNNKEIIRFAFGKYSQLTFKLANSKSNPLEPFIVFNFPLDNTPQPFESIFALKDGKFHILLKIFDLDNQDLELLNHFYNVYKIEEEDYALFDFGDFRKGDFLNNVQKFTDELSFKLNEDNHVIIDDASLNRVVERVEKYNASHCSICGKKIKKLHYNLTEISKRFPRKCEDCLTKIYVLDLYYKLNGDDSEIKMIYLSELENLWDNKGLFNYNMKLLKSFKFLIPFHDDIYKLIPNNEIIDNYSYLFKTDDEDEDGDDTDVLSDIEALLGLNDEDTEETTCRICGKSIIENESYFGSDICSECLRKQEAIEQIHKLLLYVKPSSAFTKTSLISKGLNSYDLEIIISHLLEYGLIYDDFDDLLILESKSKLNDFIKKYSDSEEDIIPDDVKEVKKISILRDSLNENSIDKVINLMDYRHFVEISHIREFDEWEVLFKKYGMGDVVYIYDNPFEAKLSAIEYLESIHIIEIIDGEHNPETNDEISLGLKKEELTGENSKDEVPKESADEDVPKTNDELLLELAGEIPKTNEIDEFPVESDGENSISHKDMDGFNSCPICGNLTSNANKTYCEACLEKYDTFDRQALLGIKEGKFNKKMALEMQSLLDQNSTKSYIVKKFKLKNTGLIEPIIKFLLGNYDLPFDIDSKPCPICGTPVSRSTKTYCDECTEKYSSAERRALVGINERIYTKVLARKMLELKKEGKRNSYIAKEVGLPNPNTPPTVSLINPIIKFALKDELDEDTLKSLEVKKKEKKVEEPQKLEKTNICLLCGEEFIPKSLNGSDKFCPKCKSEHKDLHITLRIKEGKYTKELAKEFINLQNEGLSNQQIGKQLGVSPPYINKIIDYFRDEIAFDEQNKPNLSEILEGEYFDELKGPLHYGLGKKIKKFSSNQGIIIFGYANQWYIYDIRGKTRKLIKFFNSENEAFNFWNDNDFSSVDDNIHKKEVYVNNENLILSGNILMYEYSSLLSLISSIDCDIRNMESDKGENDYYNIFLDLGLDNNVIPNILSKLEELGWKIDE